MSQFGSRARAIYDRVFPERQIIYRTCGGVRGLCISPAKQLLFSLCALSTVGWCAFATASTLLEGPRPPVLVAFEHERAKYERWLNDFRGQAEAAHDVLDETSRQFDQVATNLETRHSILRSLLEYARGSRLDPAAREQPLPIVSAPNAPDMAAPVSLQLPEQEATPAEAAEWTEMVQNVLGPAQASAATPVTPVAATQPVAPAQQDFVASINDPALAARVAQVAARAIDSQRIMEASLAPPLP